jgi:glutamine amidotransferase
MIAVVNYGLGNVGSVLNMLRKLNIEAILTNDTNDFQRAKGLILPGVGSFDRGMKQLQKYDLVPVLNNLVIAKEKPCLGICLGMQLMAQASEEGDLPGLGWIDGNVRLLQRDPERPKLRIPHMGWNFVKPTRFGFPLLEGLESHARFYFVHSYFYSADLKCGIATTEHLVPFSSVISKGNIYGCQFHPEKSHSFGLRLLSNFHSIASMKSEN